MLRLFCGALTVWALVMGAGCGGGVGTAADADRAAVRGLDRSDAFVRERGGRGADTPGSDAVRGGIAAEVSPVGGGDGFLVNREDLSALLAEASGGQVLAEVVLGRLLEERARAAGIDVGEAELAREREIVLESIAPEARAGVGEDEAERLLRAVRERRGLGPERFEGLIRRQAMLRALVADEVVVGDRQVRLAWELRYGLRAEVRLITTATREAMADAVGRVRAGEGFSVVARSASTDASAVSGGFIDPISGVDSAVPEGVRREAMRLVERAREAGVRGGSVAGSLGLEDRLSGVIRLETGFGVLLLDGVVEPEGVPLAEAREELERLMVRRQERLLMERLARDLLDGVRIRPREAALRWSWSARER